MNELSERFETHDPGERRVAEKVRCDACPVMCYIAEGQAGACDRYANESGRIVRVDPLTILERTVEQGGEVVRFLEGVWDGNPVQQPGRFVPSRFVTGIGAGTTYPDYKPAPFIVSRQVAGADLVTVVTEGIFSYCGVKVKIDTDRHLGPEQATVRVDGEPVGHVTTAEYGSQMLSLGGVRHLTGGEKAEGRVTCAALLSLCNREPVEMTIDGDVPFSIILGAVASAPHVEPIITQPSPVNSPNANPDNTWSHQTGSSRIAQITYIAMNIDTNEMGLASIQPRAESPAEAAERLAELDVASTLDDQLVSDPFYAEIVGKWDDGTYHVFARSFNAPYVWYYRRLEAGRTWTPWEKLEVDIDRAYTILKNLGRIPEPPPELDTNSVGDLMYFANVLLDEGSLVELSESSFFSSESGRGWFPFKVRSEHAAYLHDAEAVARHAFADGTALDLYTDVERSADAIGRLAGAAEARARPPGSAAPPPSGSTARRTSAGRRRHRPTPSSGCW